MSLLKAVKAAKDKEANADALNSSPKAGKQATTTSTAAAAPGDSTGQMTDFASIVKGLNLERIKKAASGGGNGAKREKRVYRMPGSKERVEKLPFEPSISYPEWSPRTVAQDAMEYMEQRESPDASPIRQMCKDSLGKQLPVKALVHHIDIDHQKVKKSRKEATLHNVTSVQKRTQRALTAEEVASNCEKSISFFRNARDANQTVAREQKQGGGWSKLRKKFLRIN